MRGIRRDVSADACPQSHGALCHTRALMKASRPWLMGPMLTGSASARSFSCPRVLLGSAPTLLCQRKIRKIQACPADMNRFSVIPGILLGGGSIHGPGHRSGAPRALVSTRQLHAESSVCLVRLHARTPGRRQVSHATRGPRAQERSPVGGQTVKITPLVCEESHGGLGSRGVLTMGHTPCGCTL